MMDPTDAARFRLECLRLALGQAECEAVGSNGGEVDEADVVFARAARYAEFMGLHDGGWGSADLGARVRRAMRGPRREGVPTDLVLQSLATLQPGTPVLLRVEDVRAIIHEARAS